MRAGIRLPLGLWPPALRPLARAVRQCAAAAVWPRTRRWSPGQLALLALGMLLGFAAFEAGYRAWLYDSYLDAYSQALFKDPTLPADRQDFSAVMMRSYEFDPHTGFRYRPNLSVDMLVPPNPHPRRFRTNSHGHVADDDYPLAKPAGEYRVAVVGDSFAAGVMNSTRWPAELERRLNANPDWGRRVGGKRTRVINTARDGIGAIQFQAVFEHDARRFDPDLVVVSLLTDDLRRKPITRGLRAGATDTLGTAREYARTHVLGRLPWFTPVPELLARSTIGSRLGLRPRLDPQNLRYSDDLDAIFADSLAALRAIRDGGRPVVFFHHPPSWEVCGTPPPDEVRMLNRLLGDGADLHVVQTAARLGGPKPDHDLMVRLYQFPHDAHPTDEGLRAYAAVVEASLLDRSAAAVP